MSDGEVYKGSRKPHVFEASHTRNRGSLRDRIGQGNGAEDMQDTREELAEMETTRRPEDNFVFNFFQHYRYPERVVFWQDGGEEESAQERTYEEKRAHANEYGRTKNPRTHARTRLTAECYILGQSERRIYIYLLYRLLESTLASSGKARSSYTVVSFFSFLFFLSKAVGRVRLLLLLLLLFSWFVGVDWLGGLFFWLMSPAITTEITTRRKKGGMKGERLMTAWAS